MTQELCLNLFNICDLETIKGVKQFMELVIDFNNNIIRNIKVLPHIQLYLASGKILFDDKLSNDLIKILSDYSKKFYIIYKNEKYTLFSTLLKNLDKDEDVHILTLLFINEEKNLEWFYCDGESINSILLYYEKKCNIKMINIEYYDFDFYYPLVMIPSFLIDCINKKDKLKIEISTNPLHYN